MSTRAPVVVVTRDERSDGTLSRALTTLGARPVPLQTVAIEPPEDPGPLRAALQRLSEFDWIVFTSGHAVQAVCTQPLWVRAWSSLTARPRVAAVGGRTAARLLERGVHVDVVPADASATALAHALAAQGDLRGARILWPCADIARPELRAALQEDGAVLTTPLAYRTLPLRPPDIDAFLRDVDAGGVDAVVFLSPSSASALAAALPGGSLARLDGHTLIGSIGPATTQALAQLGIRPDVQPEERSALAMAQAIVRTIARRGGTA